MNTDLFPDPGQPGFPASWADIERLALHYPSAQNIVALVERGDMTREQGLIALAYWFAGAFSRLFKRERDASALEMPDTITQSPCGCSAATYIRRRTVSMSCEVHRAVAAVDPNVDSTGKPSTRVAG